MATALAIALAGATGALLRWGLTAGTQRLLPGTFPWGTLVVNVLGCFALGWLATHFAARAELSLTLRTAVLSGLIGAFTTFSTFSFDTIELLRTGHAGKAAANVVLSVTVGLLAAWWGVILANRSG